MSVTIEQDLKEILTKINQRLERIEKEITDLKIGQARLVAKIDGLGVRIFFQYLNKSGTGILPVVVF